MMKSKFRSFIVLLAIAMFLAGVVAPASATVAPRRAMDGWASLDAGTNHSCGVLTDGTAWCWGYNLFGQLGVLDAPGGIYKTPRQVVGDVTTWTQISAGHVHTCGLQSDASLWCWGYNGLGQLGIGSKDDSLVPHRVDTGAWLEVAAGRFHTCGVQTDHSLWCWGDNTHGELGGDVSDETVPNQVGSATDWQSVSAGSDFTCATRTSGTAWCWGRNTYGQVGDGTRTDRRAPVQVGGANDWAAISAGGAHACAVRTGGTLWCWGDNSQGQLGDGTMHGRRTPVQVGTDSDWSTVSTGGYPEEPLTGYTCAIRSSGTLWCWGANDNGQVGDGTYLGRSQPVQIGVSSNWRSIAAGFEHTAGMRANGSAWAWGWGSYGQIGDGHRKTHNKPKRILEPTAG